MLIDVVGMYKQGYSIDYVIDYYFKYKKLEKITDEILKKEKFAISNKAN